MLKQLGLSDHIGRLPGRDLRRRTAPRGDCARTDQFPALLLADEPTSDLDEETERQIMEQFRRLNRERGVTLMMVTHNLRLAEQTDRIIHIAGGRLAS